MFEQSSSLLNAIGSASVHGSVQRCWHLSAALHRPDLRCRRRGGAFDADVDLVGQPGEGEGEGEGEGAGEGEGEGAGEGEGEGAGEGEGEGAGEVDGDRFGSDSRRTAGYGRADLDQDPPFTHGRLCRVETHAGRQGTHGEPD